MIQLFVQSTIIGDLENSCDLCYTWYMQKITPHLWFDKEAVEAAKLYTSAFENSTINGKTDLHNTPSGDAQLVQISLAGQDFMLLNAGPLFKFNPSISFLVACETKEEVDHLWSILSPGGTAMMALGAYPFSKWYGWTSDKFGLTWQIMLSDKPIHQKITPTIMYVGNQTGKTEQAVSFYTSIFHDAKVDHITKYELSEKPDEASVVKHAGFTLEGMDFAAMDGGQMHQFSFNEAISFAIHCETQDEIDYYWSKLSADPQSEQCGWLKDQFSVSWQVVPTAMETMMSRGTPEQMDRVTQAFLKMKKFDIAKLQSVYNGD